MAKVTILNEGKTIEVPDGSLLSVLEGKTNILFACKEGVCMTCLAYVEEGMENLEPPSETEKMTLSTLSGPDAEKARLLCVTRIKGGEVKIRLP
ncbi:MAG: (2Fe-2S)-binding protein [Candidatus Micrarchaeota archaeon]|nr:(2Fe-2S)-binding protein [Candidatus Micrarchaeota archaeon]